ncbi:unnamed protein product, partial [Heterotrigona itama]
ITRDSSHEKYIKKCTSAGNKKITHGCALCALYLKLHQTVGNEFLRFNSCLSGWYLPIGTD